MRSVDLRNPVVASSETARQINRSIVLNLIRARQPISRADIARLSGLQRSTVSLITEQLIADKWVVEGPLGRLPRGRRPTFLRLNDQRAIVCIDIRPPRTIIGIADVNGKFNSQEVINTPADPETAIKDLVQRIRRLQDTRNGTIFEGIGISLPGRIDIASHKLTFAPNLNWPVADLKTPIEQETGLPVELENAANACALAEMWFGRLGDVTDLVAVTVSEGIGAGIITHSQLVRGRTGMAGEFGHAPLDPNGPLCRCGNRGCWEVLASNAAALRYYFESTAREGQLTFQDLLSLAEQGDSLAAKALDTMALQLGRGMRMIVAALAPEVIVVVGELTGAWARFKPVLDEQVQKQRISAKPILLVPAQDGAMARLRGIAALVLYKHFSSSFAA